MNFFTRNQTSSLSNAIQPLVHLDYKITHDSLPHESFKKLPPDVQEYAQEQYRLIQVNPKQAIMSLFELVEKYPDVPVFYNYLRVAYEVRGKKEKSDAILEQVYAKHPDYLFAKTNYAFRCLRHGLSEEIPDIFEHKFDLKLLYPQREIFHISEFTAFTGVMALYFLMIEDNKNAETYYMQLKQFAPTHHLTEIVKYQLYPDLLPRLLDEMGIKLNKLLASLLGRFGKQDTSSNEKNGKSTQPYDYSKYF